MKILAAFLLTMLCVGSAEGATNQPPRYRLQRIEDWDDYDYSYVRTLLLNNRNQLAAMVETEDGRHFFIRGRNRTVEIPLTPEAPADSLLDFNDNGTALLAQSFTRSAYRYRRGKFVNLTNFVPYKYFNIVGINNRGRLVGGAQKDEFNPITAFSYYCGRHRELGKLLPNSHALAYAVNNHGVAAGGAQHQTNEIDYIPYSYHAVVFKKDRVHDLGVLEGALASMATGINDRGTVIGYCDFSQPTEEGQVYYRRGFVYRHGVMSPLQPLPGGFDTRPKSINRRGLIVGDSGDSDSGRVAVLFLNGETFDLNALLPPGSDADLSEALSINDRGVIAARNDYGEVFLLFPE